MNDTQQGNDQNSTKTVETNLKPCSVCGELKRLDEFHKQSTLKGGYRNECATCTNSKRRNLRSISDISSTYKSIVCPNCKGSKSKYTNSCMECSSLLKRINQDELSWRKEKNGYVVARGFDKKDVRQHTYVMENYLGRKLLPNETVHHKNGVRDDNRIQNLELWSKSQPPGQRVADKVKWAEEIINQYSEPIYNKSRLVQHIEDNLELNTTMTSSIVKLCCCGQSKTGFCDGTHMMKYTVEMTVEEAMTKYGHIPELKEKIEQVNSLTQQPQLQHPQGDQDNYVTT